MLQDILNTKTMCVRDHHEFCLCAACSSAMEAIGVKVDTDKLLHFDDLLKVLLL